MGEAPDREGKDGSKDSGKCAQKANDGKKKNKPVLKDRTDREDNEPFHNELSRNPPPYLMP